MKKSVKKNQRPAASPAARVPGKNSPKKGKWGFWVVGAVVIALVVEVLSVLKTPASEKIYYVQKVMAFNGDSQPCKAFGAWDLALSGDKWIAVSDQGQKRILIFDTQGKFVRFIKDKEAGPPPFNEISGMTSDPKGNIYVMDTWNGRIRGFDMDGQSLTKMGVNNCYGPRGVVWDNGDFLVADTGNHRLVKIGGDGKVLGAWGRRGNGKVMFDGPVAVAIDAKGNIYVADQGNNRVECLDAQGNFLRNFEVGASPNNVAVDPKGIVYITSSSGGFVKAFTTEGKYLGKLTEAAPTNPPLSSFGGLKVNSQGDIVGSHNGTIWILRPGGTPGKA